MLWAFWFQHLDTQLKIIREVGDGSVLVKIMDNKRKNNVNLSNFHDFVDKNMKSSILYI